MTHGSLFSGIGGFDLAAQWMGWENKFHCEWNEFGQKVLNHYWPDAECFGDITKADFKKYNGTIDIISGGFPCQPYSAAGKRLGKEDDRHLWPQMLRAIREIQPRWVVGENVRGLTNWNGGMVFDEVQADLEDEGYEVLPFLLPACAVNAPHRRDRIWFIAHAKGFNANGSGRGKNRGQQGDQEVRAGFRDKPGSDGSFRLSTHPGLQRQEITDWDQFPTQPPLCGRNDGLSPELAGITFSKHRNESIKAYGNAVVPQVVYQIFKAIQQYEDLT